MAYNLTRASVLRNRAQLDQLLSERISLLFKTNNPKRLAHKIREAIAAAHQFSEFEKYAQLREMYKFIETPAGVLAQYVYLEISEGERIEQKPLVGEKVSDKKREVVGAETVLDIIGFVIRHPNETEVTFPNAQLDDVDREKIWEWTRSSQGDEWKFLDHGEEGVTLTKKDVPKEALWIPE